MYRLAAHLRIDKVEQWKNEITIDQVVRWMAYYRVEPFGEDWLRAAKSTAFILAALGAKIDSAFVEMFLPGYDPDREMTDEEIAAQFRVFAQHGKG